MGASAPRLRVLLVEDSQAEARLLLESMRELGPGADFDWTHGPSLKLALESLAAHSFDAVLLDLGLIDSDGLQTLRQVAAAVPETAIVVLSGLSDEGFQSYLPRLRQAALAEGVRQDTIDRIFPTLAFSPRTVQLDRQQLFDRLGDLVQHAGERTAATGRRVAREDLEAVALLLDVAQELVDRFDDRPPRVPG